MRYILLIASFILLTISSCRMPKLTPIKTDTKPYVELKNGKKYENNALEKKSGMFGKDKIVLGDTSFKAKDVAIYSKNGITYANIGKNSSIWKNDFAPMVGTGKINLYRESYMSSEYTPNYSGVGPAGRMENKNHIVYAIQNNTPGSPVQSITYRHLKPMIEHNTPEFSMLERYRKTRIVSRSLGYGSLGLLVTGLVMVYSDNDATASVGSTLCAVSFAAFFGWMGTYVPNKMRLFKTVLKADKIEKKKRQHERDK